MSVRRGSVRIIAGEQKGRRLNFVDQGGDLRPSSDRLREMLFNWLQFELAGRRVLDLFGGSGVLAAEALSRGAAQALVLERKKNRACDLSKQLTGLFGEAVQVRCADALKWLRRAEGQWDLVFLDPPWDRSLSAPACVLLDERDLLAPEALVYMESRRHDPAPEVPEHWELLQDKESGEARARLFRVPG